MGDVYPDSGKTVYSIKVRSFKLLPLGICLKQLFFLGGKKI